MHETLPLRPLYVFMAYLLDTGASLNVDLGEQTNKIYKIYKTAVYTTFVLFSALHVLARPANTQAYQQASRT
jgi:hypothetical protein